jgi:hypothetical protein
MLAPDGEILTLRPEGFTPTWAVIESYLGDLPGTYHRPNTNAWTLVAPATDLPRMIEHLAGPAPQVFGIRCTSPVLA